MADKKKDIKFFEFENDKKSSETFNKALENVIEKDKKLLERSLTRIKKNVTRNLNKLNIDFETNEYKIDQMEDAISYNKRLIQKVTDEKNSIKIHFFTRKKKEKKLRIEELDKFIEVLNNTEKEFIFIMNEYSKLTNRKKLDRVIDIEEEIKEEKDPLLRTISFYINKNKKEKREDK